MYESYKENTSSINKKILNFIKNSILLNPNYFDNILSEEEAEIYEEKKNQKKRIIIKKKETAKKINQRKRMNHQK